MIRRSLLIAAALFTLSLTSLSAAEPEAGVIQGQLVNGTEGGSSVAGQTVTLKTYLNDSEVRSVPTETDAVGAFEFRGLSTEPDYSYEASVSYQGADYFSERVSFGEGEVNKFLELTLYDATTSEEAIRISTSDVVIYVQEGILKVGELVGFLNEGNQTYIGSREVADGVTETLRFTLPPNAFDLRLSTGLLERRVYPTDNGFVDTMPVKPGHKWVSFAYRLDLSSSRYVLTKTMDYPTDSLDIYISGEGVQAVSDQLLYPGMVEIEGEEFLHLIGANLAQDSQIDVALSVLLGGSIQEPFKWAAVGLVALALGLVLGYPIMRRKPKPRVIKADLDSEKAGLLLELARLDDRFETGGISEGEYRQVRAQKKRRLIEVMRPPEGKHSEG